MFSKVLVPAANVHAVPTEGVDPDQAAAAYDRTLRAPYGCQAGPNKPLFDVCLLGLGEDGPRRH